jgi:hypothetical protein
MAKQITIDEKTWKLMQKHLLDSLKLDKLECGKDLTLTAEQANRVSDMHRRFHYEVCNFFSAVEDS